MSRERQEREGIQLPQTPRPRFRGLGSEIPFCALVSISSGRTDLDLIVHVPHGVLRTGMMMCASWGAAGLTLAGGRGCQATRGEGVRLLAWARGCASSSVGPGIRYGCGFVMCRKSNPLWEEPCQSGVLCIPSCLAAVVALQVSAISYCPACYFIHLLPYRRPPFGRRW